MFVYGDIGPVVNPVSAIQIASGALPVLCAYIQIERQVAVSKDENIIRTSLQYVSTVLVEPFAIGTSIFGFSICTGIPAVAAEF